jgi:hypothetical protein
MFHVRCLRTLGAVALLTAFGNLSASAQEIKTVFVIAMENHNWTQPANQFTGGIQQIYQNPNAPFINSLVNGSAFAIINDSVVHISEQLAYATQLSSAKTLSESIIPWQERLDEVVQCYPDVESFSCL